MHSTNRDILAVLLTPPRVLQARSLLCIAAISAAINVLPQASQAQVPCPVAFQQVDAYYWRVRAFADGEAYRGIPMRCGPDFRCGNWWIAHLNSWVRQQVQMVNVWHTEIRRQCSRPIPVPELERQPLPPRDRRPPAETRPVGREQTVMIEIPNTPQGYRP